MKTSASRAFTLIEMLMVMVIIAIIASLIVGVAGLANRKAMFSKAMGEITAMSTACERYKSDNGAYPRMSAVTEPDTGGGGTFLDARKNGEPSSDKYKKASLFLYQQLSGDVDADGKPGDLVSSGTGASAEKIPSTIYYEFRPAMLGGITSATPVGSPGVVKFLQDPYGFSYGYSTVGSYDEEDYRQRASVDTTGKVTRNSGRGYNSTFDLWSTAGINVDPPTDVTPQRWAKNW